MLGAVTTFTFGTKRARLGLSLALALVALAMGAAQATATGPNNECGPDGVYATNLPLEACIYSTAGEHTFNVPSGITQVTVEAHGGAGGLGGASRGCGDDPATCFPSARALGGTGALVTASVTVTPGATLYAEVGSDGANAPDVPFAPVPLTCGAGSGGYNGGANGGQARCRYGGGGGGGGASDVRTAPAANGGLTGGGGDPRLVVAGGGGGGGGASFFGIAGGKGGDAGGTGAGAGTGGSGGDGSCAPISNIGNHTPGGPGGEGGVGAGAGPGGDGGTCGVAGAAGQPGLGGTGANGDPPSAPGGGGGGGGFYGGGGGGTIILDAAGGGGGGSSFGPSGAVVTKSTEVAYVTISWTHVATPCAAGSYSATGAEPCTPCPPGTTTNAPGATACVPVNQAPNFAPGTSPPLTASTGVPYGYAFVADGYPEPGYSLVPGAPSWLSIDPVSGFLSGTPPKGTKAFTYSVQAANGVGSPAIAGPFKVTVTTPPPASAKADLLVKLSCPSLRVNVNATCTLTVRNAGPAAAKNVWASLTLPSSLGRLSNSNGCAWWRNVGTWKVSSLAANASATFTVTFKPRSAGKARIKASTASSNPDPNWKNNVVAATVTVAR